MKRLPIFLLLATLPAEYAAAQTITKLSADIASVPVGSVVTLQVDLDPRADGQFWCGLEIKFGDGDSKTLRVGSDGEAKELPFRITHTYANPGEYVVQAEGKLVIRGFKSAGACSGVRQDQKVVVVGTSEEQGAYPKTQVTALQIQVASSEASTRVAEAPAPAIQSSPASPPAQQAPLEALDSCMKKKMATGAVIGAVVGGIFGRLLGSDSQKGKNTLIGAGIGAAAGGAIAWRGSYQSCTKELNLATVSSRQSTDYKDTAERYKYQGAGTILKIEEANLPSKIIAGQILNADLKFALLTPDAAETDVQVARAFQCGDTQIPVRQERFKASPGTIVSTGRIQIPSLPKDIGEQACTMWLGVSAAAQKDEWQGKFVIVPN